MNNKNLLFVCLLCVFFCSTLITAEKRTPRIADIRKNTEAYIQKEMKLKGGYYLQFDEKENKTWQLLFDKTEPTLKKTKDGIYLVTGIFKTEDYKPTVVALDFFMKEDNGSYAPVKIKIYTVNDIPRYQHRKKPAAGNKKFKGLELAPDFSLLDLDGKKVSLSTFEGKIVILNFWATWCPPCKAEIPDFVQLYKEYKNKGLQMIGISLDPDGVKAINRFTEKQKINYPVLLGTMKVTSVYGGIEVIPTTFVITPDGYIYKKYIGYHNKDVFEKDIKALLE